MPSIETHISCESTCPVEFKNGFGEIVEFRPSGTMAKGSLMKLKMKNYFIIDPYDQSLPI